LERIKAALNHELLPMFGATAQGLEFDYEPPTPPDPEIEAQQLTARANAAAALIAVGLDATDVLSGVGLPEMRYVGQPAPSTPSTLQITEASWRDAVAGLTGGDIEAAQRWVAVEHDDDHTCAPCREVNGKTYKNRAEAYKDYPDGGGYVGCVGAKYGNPCRGHVQKRGQKGEGS
jgi:hypothetical protein